MKRPGSQGNAATLEEALNDRPIGEDSEVQRLVARQQLQSVTSGAMIVVWLWRVVNSNVDWVWLTGRRVCRWNPVDMSRHAAFVAAAIAQDANGKLSRSGGHLERHCHVRSVARAVATDKKGVGAVRSQR